MTDISTKEVNAIIQDLLDGNFKSQAESDAVGEHRNMLTQLNALESQINALKEQLSQLRTRKLKLSGAMEYVLDKAVRLRHAEETKTNAAATVEPEVKGAQPVPET